MKKLMQTQSKKDESTTTNNDGFPDFGFGDQSF